MYDSVPGQDIQFRREQYSKRMRSQNVSPLWEHYRSMMTAEPKIKAVPFLWPYADVRASLMEATDLISAGEERRVLMYENPAFEGQWKASDTLFTGLQLIWPGEVAPAHRHTPNALRLILEGKGAYTSVNGEKIHMEYGDYIITPNWAWHDHGHEGQGPVIWQDVLDMPMIHAMGPMFYENYHDARFPEGPPSTESRYRYGNNLLPVGFEKTGLSSPIFAYPYARTRETLEQLARTSEVNPYFGLKMEFVDPTTGGATMPTISAFMQRLPKGFKSERYQSTETSLFTCLEGNGRIEIGSGDRMKAFDFGPKDIFVVPCWDNYKITAEDETYLFIASDKVVQQKLGLFRERIGNN